MNIKDTLILQQWLRSGASLADVERAQRIGLVGNVRFTERAVRAYRLLWTWGAARFSSAEQDRYCGKCGYPALQRRIARARAIIEKLRK